MKNKITLLFLICIVQLKLAAQNIGINATGALPHPSAMLDVSATNKGILIPRMTTAQRTAIVTPAAGLLVYDIITKGFWFYNGLSWVQLTSGAASNYWTLNGANIFKNNTGNVGIGTQTPLEKLTVQTSNNSYGISHRSAEGNILGTFIGGTSAGIGTFSNTNMRIFSNNVSRMFIAAATGNVGIGTDNPIDKLTVNTSGYGLTHTNGTIYLSTYLGGGTYGAWLGTRSNHSLFFFTNNSEPHAAILPNGNFGIGTTVPVGKLQINHAGPTAHLILNFPRPNEYSRLLFSNTGTGRYWGIAGRAGTGNIADDRLSFYNISTGFESMVMAGNGYVSIPGQLGIGTFNPAYKFSVNGTIRSKEIIVESLWADYVFNDNYKLPLLDEVEKFIQQNKHLPNIPSAKEVEEKGLQLGDTQRRMMAKIEELTLYVIEQHKMILQLQEQVKEINKK